MLRQEPETRAPARVFTGASGDRKPHSRGLEVSGEPRSVRLQTAELATDAAEVTFG